MDSEQKTCPFHFMKIEYICFHIAKEMREKKCINRFLCSVCNSELYHDKSHSKFTFKLENFIANDNSLVFFQLFFTAPQIKTLFVPLKINYESILQRLKEITMHQKLQSNVSQLNSKTIISLPSQSSHTDILMSGCDIQMSSFIDSYHSKIQNLSERINQVIEGMHSYYRDQFEWDSFIQFLKLYYEEDKISLQMTNDIISKSMQWIHCTQIFMKNVYVVDENLNLSQSKLTQTGALTTSDLLSFYKFVRRELFINLNHLRNLHQVCQITQLQIMESQSRLPLLTYFPLSSKRFFPTVSQDTTKNIKISNNQLLIVRDNECLVLLLSTSTCLAKLQNIIYSKKMINDAAISLCDANQLTLLFEDNTVGIYQIRPYISVLDNEQISLMELGNEKYKFIEIDYIKPQKIQDNTTLSSNEDNEDCDEVDDYDDDMVEQVALKTLDTVFLLDSLEWSCNNQFQNNNELIKFTVSNNEEGEDEESRNMCIESSKKSLICFHYDQQIDYIHYSYRELFENNQIKSYAVSPALKQNVYLTETELIIFSNNSNIPTKKQNRNKMAVSCMEFTTDNTYLFILYSNSQIQFYFTYDNYELEYETHLWKNGISIKKAVYNKISNQLFLLSQLGDLHNIDLSTPKNYF